MIANLLPGFRELRAPLAAGYLWLLVVWLLVEPHLPGRKDDKDAVIQSVINLGEAASSVAIAAAVTFAAFVVGSLSEGVSESVVKVVERAAGSVPTAFGIKVGGIELELSPGSSASSGEAVKAVVAESEEWIARTRRERDQISEEIETRLAERDRMLRGEEVSFDEQQLSGERIEALREREQGLDEAAKDAERRLIEAQSALEDRPIASRILKRLMLSRRGHRAIESLVREKRNALLPRLAGRGLSISDALGKEMERRVADAGTVTNALFAQTLDELDLTRTRLIGDQPELFSAVDRPRAEAEFRFALVPPLSALAVTLAALDDNLFWLLGLLVSAAIFVQGVRRRRAAGDLLADALYLGRVQAPVLERLERASGLPLEDTKIAREEELGNQERGPIFNQQ